MSDPSIDHMLRCHECKRLFVYTDARVSTVTNAPIETAERHWHRECLDRHALKPGSKISN